MEKKETNKKNSKRKLIRGGIAGLALLFLGAGAKVANDHQRDLLNNIKVQKIVLDDIQKTLDDEFNKIKDTLDDKYKKGLTKEELDAISKTVAEFNNPKESDMHLDEKYEYIVSSNSSDSRNSDYLQDSHYNNNNNTNNNNTNNNNGNNQGSRPEKPEEPVKPEKPEHNHTLKEVITTYTYKGKNTEGKDAHIITAHMECTDSDCGYIGEDYTREAECNVSVVTDDIGKTASCDICGYTDQVHTHTTVTTNTPVSGNPDICYTSSLDCTDPTCDYHKDLGGHEHTYTDVIDYDDWSNPTQEQRECSHVHDNGTKCTATKWFDYQATTSQLYSVEENSLSTTSFTIFEQPEMEKEESTDTLVIEKTEVKEEVIESAPIETIIPQEVEPQVEPSVLMETPVEEDVINTNSEQLDDLVAFRQLLIDSSKEETIGIAKTYIKQQRC